MSIRSVNKDHLKSSAPLLSAVASIPAKTSDDPLVFWTQHPKSPYLVDLHFLADGQHFSLGVGKNWRGALSGRPTLTRQLAPAIKDKLLFAPKATCGTYLTHMRAWWRLLDEIESRGEGGLAKVTTVSELSSLHGRAALDAGFSANVFSSFRSVADATRRALGQVPLAWVGPDQSTRKRHLPPQDQIAIIWVALKHGWFAVLNRWRRAEKLIAGDAQPASADEELQLANYQAFARARAFSLAKDGRAHPSHEQLRQAWVSNRRPKGVGTLAMYNGFYPNSTDVRTAFHLCLAGSGWNPQTLLDLDVDVSLSAETRTPFLRPHPSDSSRYIMIGQKERGKSGHILYGDWKTDRSPGAVIHALIEQTWPMRQQILLDLETAKTILPLAIDKAEKNKKFRAEISKLRVRIGKLKRASTSVWLYFDSHGSHGVQCLTEEGYASRTTGESRFLPKLIDGLNKRHPTKRPIPYIVAGDFRDAFAHYVWQSSGGSILHVMKALGHRSPRTSMNYLDNTAVNTESGKIFSTFSNALWTQLTSTGRLDTTLLAKVTRDGNATAVEMERLDDYRALQRSRLGVSCKDPRHPPITVDPAFVVDGNAMCTVQRCTLCLENAIITPESMSGLSMRLAELHWLKEHIPIDAFINGEFESEMSNTTVALTAFDTAIVEAELTIWKRRISQGDHRVVEFQGIATSVKGRIK